MPKIAFSHIFCLYKINSMCINIEILLHICYYIRQRSWANVMYSPLFVTLQNRRFLQSILVTAVCLSPAFVRLFAMYRPQYWSDRSDFVPADVFWSHDDGKMFWSK